MGIRNATLIMAATQPARYGIHDILEEAVEINRISDRRPAAPLGTIHPVRTTPTGHNPQG